MDTPKKMSKRSLLNNLNNQIAKLDGLPLSQWLDAASKIIPMEDGIYCGREGRVKEQIQITDYEIWLTMGWYTVSDTPKVEYAYLS